MVPEAALHDGRNRGRGVRGGPRRDAAPAWPAPEHSGADGRPFTFPRRAYMRPCSRPRSSRWPCAACGGGGGGGGTREAPGGGADLRRVPGRHAAAARRQHRRRALSATSPTSRPTPPGSRTPTRSTTRPSRPCPRSWTRPCRRRGTAADVRSHQPQRLPPVGPARLRDPRRPVGRGAVPAAHLPGARSRRPGVLNRLGRRRAAGAAARTGPVRSGERDRPTFYFQHALLPHEPWIYLPSGRQSRPTGNDPIPEINARAASTTRRSEPQPHAPPAPGGLRGPQLGLLLDRLRRTGLFDQARSSVMADHGYRLRDRRNDSRLVTERNIDEVAPVPAVRQGAGADGGRGGRKPRAQHRHRSHDRRPARHARLAWRHDGRSRFSASHAAREVAHPHARLQPGDPHRPRELRQRRAANRAPARRLGAPERRAGCCTATRGRACTGSARIPSCSDREVRRLPAGRPEGVQRRGGQRRPAARRARGRADSAHAGHRQARGRRARRPERPRRGRERPHRAATAAASGWDGGRASTSRWSCPRSALRAGAQPRRAIRGADRAAGWLAGRRS